MVGYLLIHYIANISPISKPILSNPIPLPANNHSIPIPPIHKPTNPYIPIIPPLQTPTYPNFHYSNKTTIHPTNFSILKLCNKDITIIIDNCTQTLQFIILIYATIMYCIFVVGFCWGSMWLCWGRRRNEYVGV